MKLTKLFIAIAVVAFIGNGNVKAQRGGINWTKDGNSYYQNAGGEIVTITLPKNESKTIVSRALLTPANASNPLNVRSFQLTVDGTKALIYTNTKRVWRQDSRGDYWVADIANNTLKQIGKGKPVSSLMFAKFSPDATKVAYVSEHNVYVEDLATGAIKALTTDGTSRMINGTFDWVYEEEFNCLDGFRWSPDSKSIAYWQIDATKIKNFLMINNTDSIYSFTVPVEYPKVGQDPSACKIGVVDIATAKTNWLAVPGDNIQHYIPRMDWIPNTNEVILQQLNREQNESKLFIANATTGSVTEIYKENDKAWIDPQDSFVWLNGNKEFVYQTEKDGYTHLYRVNRDGKKETLITKGNYDVISVNLIDEKNNTVYFMASPTNATQKYLYKTKLDGKGKLEMVTPSVLPGTHSYSISPNGLYARHSYNSSVVAPVTEWMNFTTNNPLTMEGSITNQLAKQTPPKNKVEFFKVTTEDGVEMDGWMKKPDNFDATKKYPVVFYVYGEPASQTAADVWGAGRNGLYVGDMAKDGYIYISMDNRGAPVPKGAAWRKAIYKNIGVINIRDQAMATKKLLATYSFMDKDRVAVHGWSGGGSSTLNLLFQYPDIYKTGIAVAAVANQLTYDNIYQERYMGTPFPTTEAYVKGSPITYAKNLVGNLLYIHGTGDDNVHYQNAEMLINELVKNKKVFQMMSYPNRTHGIFEGAGTSEHLALTYTKFLKEYCPPGAR
ncbi:prolyl oligopeptidase family serine peptidase [Pedobacter sp. LMG 31464]|uniref:Prolyl oligopeptidase family serine peptidase n=1 Tax=Pedobacter planticolens TaxID=2679964 RepID=A0A923DW11_9SPHI|nr:S9 family peptidase [Pedobacter planticolens]MBB2144994.1 prolyl oligopeptidase family serine peptidase [Pedobacter planticolens]